MVNSKVPSWANIMDLYYKVATRLFQFILQFKLFNPKMRPLPSTACQVKPQVRIEVQNGTWHPWSDPKSFPTHRSHSRGTPRFPARLQLSPFTPPDRDKMVDSPALSGRGSRSSWCTSGWHQSNEEIRDVASWMVPRSERPRFPALLLKRTRCPDTSLKATLWMKASLGQEDLLGMEMATHSSIRVWKIPWTEKPGGLQSMRSPGLPRAPQDEACLTRKELGKYACCQRKCIALLNKKMCVSKLADIFHGVLVPLTEIQA